MIQIQTEKLLFSTAGKDTLLVALPESNLMGGAHAKFLPVPEIEVNLFKTIPNELNNGYTAINVYEVTLKAQAGRQPFVVQQPLPVPQPQIEGLINLATHPVMQTEMIHVEMPVGGLHGQPFSLALKDQSGSTGYHWEIAGHVGSVKIKDTLYPSEIIGGVGVQLFNIIPTEPGQSVVHLQLLPPGKTEPVYAVNVAIDAWVPKE